MPDLTEQLRALVAKWREFFDSEFGLAQRAEHGSDLQAIYSAIGSHVKVCADELSALLAAAEGVERDAARWHEGEVSQVEWEDSDRIIVHIEKDEGDVVMWEDVREGARVRVTPMRDSGEGRG